MLTGNLFYVSFSILLCLLVKSYLAFDGSEETEALEKNYNTHSRKDRILFSEVKKLVFQRYKRTTSRRTHPIHQLTCVGGTAGCKLFTPDIVECEKLGYNNEKSKYDWRCHAELSDRVAFNHVEVICEGYDYPEDDYILLGSCGLEFSLDYTDPHDYHPNSYFRHMDEHEKELHHERVRKLTNSTPVKPSLGYLVFFQSLISNLSNHIFLISVFSILAIFSFLIVKLLVKASNTHSSKRNNPSKESSYRSLTSSVSTTKKAC